MKSVTASRVNGWAAGASARVPAATQPIAIKIGTELHVVVIQVMSSEKSFRASSSFPHAQHLGGFVFYVASEPGESRLVLFRDSSRNLGR